MLYISSASKTDSYTAFRTLSTDCAPDGGVYMPYRLPSLETSLIEQMCSRSFGENVADILNLFFSAGLTAWDVECCAGRTPVRLAQMSHRLVTAECFHNPLGSYSYLESNLYARLSGDKVKKPTTWARIAIRIAVMFAVHGLLPEEVRASYDVAVSTGDFSMPMAAWYCRKMGLPIRTVICCCNDNSAAWDLIRRGEFNAGAAAVNTGMPELDYACPIQAEQLIYHTLGFDHTKRYRQTCAKRGIFHLDEESLTALSAGLSASVVGRDRVGATMRSVYRTNSYLISQRTAIAYGGLQDYRSRSGESRFTLILAEDSPMLQPQKTAELVGIPVAELTK